MTWLQHTYRRVAYGRPLVVVSGLPRSGTSMMMKVLEAGGVPVWLDGIRSPDEQNPNGYYELERVKDLEKVLDKSWVREGRGRAVKVISSLLQHLPPDNNYHVLFMQRNLREIVDSQTEMLRRRGESEGPATDTLVGLYETHLSRVKSFLACQPGFSAMEVNYRDVLSDPDSAAQRINAFLGGRLDVWRMSRVVDTQLYRIRSKTLLA